MILSQGEVHDVEYHNPSGSEGRPPPYTNTNATVVHRAGARVASVNQPHLRGCKEPLKGTFYIDPKVPALGPFDSRKFKSRKDDPPHASFYTRKGKITLELATVGDVEEAPKTSVMVANRSGNIMIKLLPAAVNNPRIDLEVYSRKGEIALFLPQSFSGVLRLKSRNGRFHLLPEFAAATWTIQKAKDEVLLLVRAPPPPGGGKSQIQQDAGIDFCQLHSRSGRLVLGISGMDKYEPQPRGFWKRMFGRRED